MVAVRLVVLAALVTWVGGLVLLQGVVSPTVVRVMAGADSQHAPLVSSLVLAAILQQFHLVAYTCGAIVVVGLFVMKFVGPPPPAFVPRLGLVTAMLVSAVYTGVPMARERAQLRADMVDPVDRARDQRDGDPRQHRLDTLDQRTAALLSLNVGFGLLSLFWYARE